MRFTVEDKHLIERMCDE